MRQLEFKPLGLVLTISVLLNALLWAATWLFPQEGPAAVLTSPATFPLVGLVVLVGNVFLAFLLRKTSKRAAAVLCAAALAAQVMLIVLFGSLWRLNQ